MRVAIVGGSGLIGSYLKRRWQDEGHTVILPPREVQPSQLEDFDLLVNLAGENIFGRWTAGKKDRILQSRVIETERVSNELATIKNPPKLWINASAVGYYGDRGDEVLDESSSQGNLFLSTVCSTWEKAAKAPCRIVFSRFGSVITPDGGALRKLLIPFKLGLGGPIGDGTQWMSWITLCDIKGAIDHLMENKDIKGPVNFVAPEPIMSKTFTETLANVLNRPHFFPAPKWALEAVMGQMADELLLSSARVVPTKLQSSGYVFRDPTIEKALTRLVGHG